MPDDSLTILIAEDSLLDRMLLATIVSRQGYRVLEACNGLEALGLFRLEQPDLVLMDAMMPIMDGFEAARRIKACTGEALVPIIFLTSLSEGEALARCLEAGGDDFIAKPYDRVIIEAKIKAMARLRRLPKTV
jgi:two-component system, HptB-dependent secretion and biofilm response regulator